MSVSTLEPACSAPASAPVPEASLDPELSPLPIAQIATYLRLQSATFITVQWMKDDGEPGSVYRYQLDEGMTIGRDADNFIRLQLPDVCAHHARIDRSAQDGLLHARVLSDGFAFTMPSGNDATDVPLLPGTTFKLGAATFRCPGEPPKVRVACPRCRGMLAQLPAVARFCPRCGVELPAYCPPWSLGQLTTAAAAQNHPSLLAYLNALFNLGMRCESLDRNLPQAVRYYEKAAKLGNIAAAARLGARAKAAS
jgi:hypothetical protein